MKRTVPIVLMALGILLLFGSGWLFLDGRVHTPADVSLPTGIASLPLTQKTSGEAAITEFENLHGKQFPVISGSIGVYGTQQITLWVAGTASPSLASGLVGSMQAKIAGGNSPFTPLEQFQQGSRSVYVLEGMGQKHYYFQSKNLVIWLAADRALADQSIQQILEVYP
jgi:hypothetical protein